MTYTDCKGRECIGSFTSEEEFLDFAIPSPPEGTDKCAAYEALTCDPKGGEYIFEGPAGFRVDANTADGARELRLFLHGSLPTIGTNCPGCFSYTSCRPGCRGMFPALWGDGLKLDVDRIPALPPKGQTPAFPSTCPHCGGEL